MKRTQFLSTLGIGLAAACTGCLAGCGKGGEAAPGGGTNSTPAPPTGFSFTFDLNNDIKVVGDSKVSNGVIVVRIGTANVVSSFTAVQVACTHEGTSVGYSVSQGNFVCPLHFAMFTNAGVVISGPAPRNLKQYPIIINGNSLSVTG